MLIIREQFLSMLNTPIYKSHWIKSDNVTYAMYQTFCHDYCYFFRGFFTDALFNVHGITTIYNIPMPWLNSWFKEWKNNIIKT